MCFTWKNIADRFIINTISLIEVCKNKIIKVCIKNILKTPQISTHD